jgi:hypothetical protein
MNKMNAPYGAVEIYCNSQLQPFFRTLTAIILFGLLEEALPAQYALAFLPNPHIATFTRN